MSHTIPPQKTEKIDVRIPVSPATSEIMDTHASDAERAVLQQPEKPLEKANHTAPIRKLTNAQLKRIAAANPPSAEWFQEEPECHF